MPTEKSKRVAGGAATGGGMNFQAAVSAIACVYMARGQKLSWLEKLTEDVPVAIEAETGGAGDDLCFLLKSGEVVEIQVKKGLRSGKELWDSLTRLASAYKAGTIDYGVLVVSSTSSNTITEDLAKDIVRLGDGRTDNLSNIATILVEKLNLMGLPIGECCRCIRIQTVNALSGNQADILAARSELAHLCADQIQVVPAWNILYKDAAVLIEQRGRREVSSVLRLLCAEGVKLAEKNPAAPVLLLEKLSNWTFATHANFSIFGVKKALRTDKAWIPLRAIVRDATELKVENLSDALEKYQSWAARSVHHDAVIVDPETLARFVTRVILIGGPGMGKTTLLKRIARRYSEDHIPVLHVRLTAVVSRMRAGSSFEEAVFDLGLDGSGISSAEARQAGFPNWLLLCDGLDECGKLQEEVAAGVARFAAGHPDCRVLVTTRPVGYDTVYFSDWRHYYLAPLEPSSAPAHLAVLVAESALEDSSFQEDINALCTAELERDETSKVVARSPLLLGLAASIIVRGGHLAATKERLYEQIFELIDEVPNSRIPEPPTSSVLLRRYLDILGWHITANPLSRISNTLDCCAEELARETGSNSLMARVNAEACLRYWQDVGMVERIGHGCEEALAFIHKSFGEFAAARHLRSMSFEEQHFVINNILDASEWVEVIRFAALLGLADIVGDILISSEAFRSSGAKRIVLAVELVAAATLPPRPALRESILREAFKVISSIRRLQAFEIGGPLVAAARRFPEEVGPLAAGLLSHEQSWTYLIAWATVVVAGPSHYHLEDLAEALHTSIGIVGPGIRSSLGGGVILGGDGGQDLLQSFTLDAASVLIEHSPSELTDSIVIEALNSPNLGTLGFISKARKLLRSKGKTWTVGKLDDKYIWQLMSPPEGYLEAELTAYKAIFDSLDLPATFVEEDRNPGVLLHFSAFLESSKFGQFPISDIWAWTYPFDKEATRETLKGFIGVSNIDVELLRRDALQARSYLLAAGANEPTRLLDIMAQVDPPMIDLSKALTLGLDATKIETALYHPSEWIIWLATNLIGNLLTSSELELVVQRLFENGKERTLWAACVLAAELNQDRVIELLFERLSNPLVRGCGHLFKFLQKLDLQWGAEISGILRSGFKGDVETASEAAMLVANLAKPGQADLAVIIGEALIYWAQHEKPYPTQGGVIPPSPRAKLVDALMKIRKPSYSELRSYATDPRTDVKDVAKGALMECLRLPGGHRVQFLNEISTEVLPPNLLSKALEIMSPLSPDELALWESLMVSNNPKIRFSAMSLLHKDYLNSASISAHAHAMTGDSEQQIRDRAYRILDML
jgi:hypothetical protein